MTDLVERLREGAYYVADAELTNEAADRIESLEKSVNTFRKAYSKQKRQKCALRVELQQRVDELEKNVIGLQVSNGLLLNDYRGACDEADKYSSRYDKATLKIKSQHATIEQLEAAICISVREEFSEAEVEDDKQAIEWFTGTFNETNYRYYR